MFKKMITGILDEGKQVTVIQGKRYNMEFRLMDNCFDLIVRVINWENDIFILDSYEYCGELLVNFGDIIDIKELR